MQKVGDRLSKYDIVNEVFDVIGEIAKKSDFISAGLKGQDVSLPVNEAGNPDYDKMAIIISAIHKLVIKDVVTYSDRKIKETKAVVK